MCTGKGQIAQSVFQHFLGWVKMGDNITYCFWKGRKPLSPHSVTHGFQSLLHIPFLDCSLILGEEVRGKVICLILPFCHSLAVSFCCSLQTEGRAGWVVMKQSSLKTIC